MDKAPNFGLAFFYRVVLPGAVTTLILGPLLFAIIRSSSKLGPYEGQLLLGSIILFGFGLSVFGDAIYEMYEGRKGWPRWLSRRRTIKWQRYVSDLLSRAQDPNAPEYEERWAELRQFPTELDEEKKRRPVALAPTRMGNILAAYEQYPQVRYGMPSAFYWDRLWLALDRDVRQEIDSSWAPTDALLFASFGVALCGVVYATVGVFSMLAARLGLTMLSPDEIGASISFAVALFVAARLPYLWSLPGHVANGESFRSAFDLFRSRLSVLAPADQAQIEQSLSTYQRLQYGAPGTESEEPGPKV